MPFTVKWVAYTALTGLTMYFITKATPIIINLVSVEVLCKLTEND